MSDGIQQPLRVFISSTYVDLKDYRQRAIEVVERYKCLPLAMELFMAQPQEPTKVCEKEVKQSDIFMGIYAHRFGFVPDGQPKSITQQEYELARTEGKDCLCFIVDAEFPWKPTLCEFDKKDRLDAFLKVVREQTTVAFFGAVPDFESKLSASLGKLLVEKLGTEEDKKHIEAGGRLIPVAPTPYIAHPYPLPEHFTGRQAEKSMLSNWLYNGREPMFGLEAIGGMGKTALAWVWLHEEVLDKQAELDGVFWWSFYESPFETFIEQLYHYLTSREVLVDRGALQGGAWETLQSILHNNRFLLVLDGFERALRGYSGLGAMYIQEKGLSGQPDADEDWDRHQREPVHPHAGKFLRALAGCQTRTLMTTRLFPAPLEGISGVRHEALTGLSPNDAVRFLRTEGIAGTRAEMERAGEVYGFHPLMLKQLASAIKRTRKKDIKDAFKSKLIDEKEPQKILHTSFSLLNKDEKQVATTVSVLRSAFSFETAKALLPDKNEDYVWQVLRGLQQLGFLFYDEKSGQFDFHPIMRSFLYDSLTTRERVHEQAAQYFQALPKVEKVIRLEDLACVIELYHHLIGAGKFDQAWSLFRDRLAYPVYFQLSGYTLQSELLKALFPDGEDKPPRLKGEAEQAWTLSSLANSYALSGQPTKAVPLYLMHNRLQEKNNGRQNLAIGLAAVAAAAQPGIGRLSGASGHLRKSISLCQEIKDKLDEAIGHQELGRVLAYQGGFRSTEEELTKAFDLAGEGQSQIQGLAAAYRSLASLLQARSADHARESGSLVHLEEAHHALGFAEKTVKARYPYPRDFVQAYRLLGEALVQCRGRNISIDKPVNIRLYDEHFQQVTESVEVREGSELQAAERCLTEALRRCRSVNLIEMEADVLLAWARLEWAKGRTGARELLEEMLKEAQEIAERAGYRLQMVDIHLFCGEVLVELREGLLLGLGAREHLAKAKEYALDVSTFDDLYQSPDPHFYDGIPEYEMLKRGMTDQERIENGYYVAWQIADRLEKRLK
jgi:tetratricopeptide (TPR) repeat protein